MNTFHPVLTILEPFTKSVMYTSPPPIYGNPFQQLQQHQILTLVAEEYMPFFIDARERVLSEMKELHTRRSGLLKKHFYTSSIKETLASILNSLPKEVYKELSDMDTRMSVLMTAVRITSVNCSTTYITSTGGQPTADGDIKVTVRNAFGEDMVMQAVSVPQTAPYNSPMPHPPYQQGMGMPSFGAPYPGAPFGAQQQQPPVWPYTAARANGFPSQAAGVNGFHNHSATPVSPSRTTSQFEEALEVCVGFDGNLYIDLTETKIGTPLSKEDLISIANWGSQHSHKVYTDTSGRIVQEVSVNNIDLSQLTEPVLKYYMAAKRHQCTLMSFLLPNPIKAKSE